MGIGQDLLDLIAYGKTVLEDLEDDITRSISYTYQAIVDIWSIDCEGEWILYVKTGVTAAGAALYLLITPTFEEVLENYLEPKPGRLGGRRGRPDDRDRRTGPRGRRQLYFKPGIPDIDSEVASWLPGSDMISGRKFGPGEYIFWTGLNVADRIAWQFLLVEATETFFTRWMSGLMQGGQCQWENDGSCQFHTPTHTSFVSKILWASKFDLLFLQDPQNIVGNNGEVSFASGSHIADWMATGTANWTLTGLPGTGYAIVEVGIRVEGWDALNNKLLDESSTTQITVYHDDTQSTEVTLAQFPYGLRRLEWHYVRNVIFASNSFDESAWSEVACAYRNYRVQ
jgi:hypothetical protein